MTSASYSSVSIGADAKKLTLINLHSKIHYVYGYISQKWWDTDLILKVEPVNRTGNRTLSHSILVESECAKLFKMYCSDRKHCPTLPTMILRGIWELQMENTLVGVLHTIRRCWLMGSGTTFFPNDIHMVQLLHEGIDKHKATEISYVGHPC